MKWPSDRISKSSPKNYGMYAKAEQLIREDIDLIHLELGKPTFDTPQHIKDAAILALQNGMVHYGDFRGNDGFRAAIVKQLAANNNLNVSADEVVVTNGLTHASYASFMAAIDPGDEVILLEPYYPQHVNKIEMAGGVVVKAKLDRENRFAIDGDAIEAVITEKTKMICLVNPANPTGRVYSRNELQVLADLATKHDLLVLSDEVYERICYDDNQHISIASLPGMYERTLTLFAMTKAYAMDGWRVGYIVADKKFIPAILDITTNDVTHVNVFIQEGARVALEGSQEALTEMVREDKRRRDLVVERMNRMQGVTCDVPEATIYAYPNISATGKPSDIVAEEILHQCHVVVEDGAFYGSAGEGHLRICFGSESYDRIEQALNRMEDYFARNQTVLNSNIEGCAL